MDRAPVGLPLLGQEKTAAGELLAAAALAAAAMPIAIASGALAAVLVIETHIPPGASA